ncbi:hypothetical protein HDEF_2243 [Candidatus Hamiltonella defensa 5AT (Acyrthosiphon pisum)]|uniref:Uncharacterized protein n=1 Tax=Hamiltonella defensa subsp. Acyrthosiphon pisum (strain 5AT) TaxID=572265 RepID=C4K8C9_HAMD5|nr:hypothetical protein HDEF_2243 [Candidatus Hamiltonella defensa 5AT (Acyrthosiphon pisum)]
MNLFCLTKSSAKLVVRPEKTMAERHQTTKIIKPKQIHFNQSGVSENRH